MAFHWTRSVVCALLIVLLPACATNPVPPRQNLKAETDDLGMVADHALYLAGLYGADRVLVVLDIDNTLLAMEQGLGSDQWYYWQKDLEAADPCSPLRVNDRFAVQGALFFASAMRPTQPDAAEQVRRIQSGGLPLIALTSRGADYRLATFRELRRNGIRFWPNALPPREGWPDTFIPAGGSGPTLYQDGVFMTAGQHKGVMLKALLDRTGTALPAVIVTADDKWENLQDILETFGSMDVSVHAWRFSREDAAVAAFDGQRAAAEWRELEPALLKIQEILGPDNYELADDPVECAP